MPFKHSFTGRSSAVHTADFIIINSKNQNSEHHEKISGCCINLCNTSQKTAYESVCFVLSNISVRNQMIMSVLIQDLLATQKVVL